MSHNVREQFQQSPPPLAEFGDQNINRTTARAQTELERLQNECDLAFNVYNFLAQRVEQTCIKVQEQTPVVSVIQPVQVPVEESEPRKALILITFTLLAIFITNTFLTILYLKRYNVKQ